MRDRDANTAWTAASDSNREERRYHCPIWRADTGAIVTSAGKWVESGKNASYGTPFGIPACDTDSDGAYNATDATNVTSGSYDVRKDGELDGDADASDVTYAGAIVGGGGGGYYTLGRGVLSSSTTNNRKGYGGYEFDRNLAKLGHVRNRVLDTVLGRWTRRTNERHLSLYSYPPSQSWHTSLGTTVFFVISGTMLEQDGLVRPPFVDPGFPGHIHGNHCGKGYGDNLRDCKNKGDPDDSPFPWRESQRCGQYDRRDEMGLCPEIDCLDIACAAHDRCYYKTCTEYNILPGQKTECQKLCDQRLCQAAKNCKGADTARLLIRLVFCQWNEGIRDGIDEATCDNGQPDRVRIPPDIDPRVPWRGPPIRPDFGYPGDYPADNARFAPGSGIRIRTN
jgi:hypothetical protein